MKRGHAMPTATSSGSSSTRASSQPTAAVIASSAPTAMKSPMSDYAARNEAEIAALFPVPSDDAADRLVDLLLPQERTQPRGEEAA